MRRKQKRKVARAEPRYNVYVIRLDDAVLEHKKFRDANPGYIKGKPCVYVGMTSATPKERFAQHKRGYKANRYAKRYGKFLRWKLFEKYNPMTFEQASRREAELAEELRKKRGYAVWQK